MHHISLLSVCNCRLPELQGLVWMLLGTAHVAAGHFHEASVCYLHHLAFCRELGDFVGITRAECNLGIAYTKLGLVRLAGRCFLQVCMHELPSDYLSIESLILFSTWRIRADCKTR